MSGVEGETSSDVEMAESEEAVSPEVENPGGKQRLMFWRENEAEEEEDSSSSYMQRKQHKQYEMAEAGFFRGLRRRISTRIPGLATKRPSDRPPPPSFEPRSNRRG